MLAASPEEKNRDPRSSCEEKSSTHNQFEEWQLDALANEIRTEIKW